MQAVRLAPGQKRALGKSVWRLHPHMFGTSQEANKAEGETGRQRQMARSPGGTSAGFSPPCLGQGKGQELSSPYPCLGLQPNSESGLVLFWLVWVFFKEMHGISSLFSILSFFPFFFFFGKKKDVESGL